MMSAGWSLHRGRGLLVLLVVALLGVAVAGCTSFFNHNLVNRDETPSKLVSGVVSDATKPLSAGADSCVTPIVEPERSQLLEQALADSQLQAVRTQLENRGFTINTEEAMTLSVAGGEQLLIPFGNNAHLVWDRYQEKITAFGLIEQNQKTLNITPDGQERWIKILAAKQIEKLLKQLREKSEFKKFEKQIKEKGKKLADARAHAMLDETRGVVSIGLTTENSADGRFPYQLRVHLKANTDDNVEQGENPEVQQTACGQILAQAEMPKTSAASESRAVPTITGDGDPPPGGTGGGDICTSTWGYQYLCYSTSPQFSIADGTNSDTFTFLGGQSQLSIIFWNYGGGRLTGTASIGTPFSIVSGGSYSLYPGQLNTVVVTFNPPTAGAFVGNLRLTNGSTAITVYVTAWTVTVNPSPINFGDTFIGNPPKDQFMSIKNYAPFIDTGLNNLIGRTVTVNLSTAMPYNFGTSTSSSITVGSNETKQVLVRLNPTASGTFQGSVQLSASYSTASSSNSVAVSGTAHQLSFNPSQLSFTSYGAEPLDAALTATNVGTTTVTLSASTRPR